jgi:hypothetical protein
MLVELACVEEDGTKREPTDVERTAISAAVDRHWRDVHVQDAAHSVQVDADGQ